MKSLSIMASNNKKVLALLVVITAATLPGLAVANTRNVDGDEGFYALASRLTVKGHTPYLDFFYPQMPGLPYIYGLWMRIFGFSWASGRLFSILLYALSALLLSNYLRLQGHNCQGHNWLSLLFLGGIYSGNGLLLAWTSVIKTFALTLLILVATFVALLRWVDSSKNGHGRRFWLAVAGLVFGVGIEVRLMLLPVLAFLILWIVCQSWHRGLPIVALDVLVFGGSVVVTLIPLLWLYWQSPWRFVFNNVGYHLGRHGQVGLIYDFAQKFKILKQLAFLRQGWPLLIMSALGLAVVYWPRRTANQREDNAPTSLALIFLVSLGVTFWLVTPSFTQYFCLLVPFAVVLINPLMRWLGRVWPLRWQILMEIVFLGGYLATAPADMQDEIGRVGSRSPDFRLSVINYISQFIAEHTEPEAVIISWWPGYVFTNQREIYPGMENHFSRGLAEGVSIREGIPLELASAWTRVASNEEILSLIAEGKADAVIVGIWRHRIGEHRPTLDALLAKQYTLAARVYSTSIYLKLQNVRP